MKDVPTKISLVRKTISVKRGNTVSAHEINGIRVSIHLNRLNKSFPVKIKLRKVLKLVLKD